MQSIYGTAMIRLGQGRCPSDRRAELLHDQIQSPGGSLWVQSLDLPPSLDPQMQFESFG